MTCLLNGFVILLTSTAEVIATVERHLTRGGKKIISSQRLLELFSLLKLVTVLSG